MVICMASELVGLTIYDLLRVLIQMNKNKKGETVVKITIMIMIMTLYCGVKEKLIVWCSWCIIMWILVLFASSAGW